MDTTQLFLTFVLVLSTGFLVIVGLQIVFALREFRKTLGRVNGILNNVESASQELETGVSGVMRYFQGFKSLLKTLEIINLLTPLHDYLKRRHKLPETSRQSVKSSNSIHNLINKMKNASETKQEKKFIIKGSKSS